MSAADQEIPDFAFETPPEEKEANANINGVKDAPLTTKNIQTLKTQIIEIDQLFSLFALKESEITQKNQEIIQKDQEIIKKNQDIASLRAGLTKLRDQVSIPVQECERLRKEVKSLNIQLEEKETRLKEQGKIIGDAQRVRSDNQNFMNRIRSLEALKSQLEFKIQENENNASSNDQIKKELQKFKKEFVKKEEKCNKFNTERLALEERIKQIEAEKNQLEETVKVLESEVERRRDEDLERELNEGLRQESLAEKDSKIADLDEELKRLRNEMKSFNQIRSECEKLRCENHSLKASEKSQTNDDQQNEILKLQRELAELKSIRQNNHNIEQQLKTANEEIEKLRQMLRDRPKETLDIHPNASNQFLLAMQELNASKKTIENLEKVKIALQDLVTTQQIQIMDLRDSKQAVMPTVSVLSSNVIQKIPNKDPLTSTHSNPDLTSTVLPILEEPRKRRKNSEHKLGDNNTFVLMKPDPKKRKVSRQGTTPSISNSNVVINKKLQELAENSESIFHSIKSLQSFAFEQNETLIQAIDQNIKLLRTPHNLKPVGETDQVKNIVDLKGRSIPIPVVLPKREAVLVLFLWYMSREFPDSIIIEKFLKYTFKQIVLSKNKSNDLGIACRLCRIFAALCRISRDVYRPRTLCFDLIREIHKIDYVVKIVENIAKIWPQVLHSDISSNSQVVTILGIMESIIANNVKDPSLYTTFVRYCSWNQLDNTLSLQARLQALSELIQSSEFQIKCRTEADNAQFQEYRYNLIKSFELVACWSPWPEFYENVVCGVLLPLVDNEDLAGIPIEILGEVCRKGILDAKKKKEVSEVAARLCQNLALQSEASLIQKARYASVILNLAEGDLEFVDAVFRWHSSLEVKNGLPSVLVEQLKFL
ncbi:11940_t:CDS:10, partial [Ambispora leptoticha]